MDEHAPLSVCAVQKRLPVKRKRAFRIGEDKTEEQLRVGEGDPLTEQLRPLCVRCSMLVQSGHIGERGEQHLGW